MLIARITGGIGNQLFQYAFARSLATKYDQNFKLDLSWYNDFDKYEDANSPNAATKRKYLLDKFNIKNDILNSKYMHRSQLIREYLPNKAFQNIWPLSYYQYKNVDKNDFDAINFNKKVNIRLTGVWQNQNIIENYIDIFRKEITLRHRLNEENQKYLIDIQKTESVAVHIRRGDLLNRPVAVESQPASSDKYYLSAIDILKTKLTKPKFFIFSDDIQGVKENYNFSVDTVFIDNDGPDYEHFNLMCNCKHHIIANSTFSWWAAWLNSNSEKIIIAPKCWYRDPIENESIIRIPKDWVILENMK